VTSVVLITASPREIWNGVATTLRLAGGGNRKGYHYGGNHYRAGVATLPRFRAEIGFDETGWTGGVVPTTAAIAYLPYSASLLAEAAGYFWPGAAVTVQEGPEETAVFSTRLTGKIADATVQEHRLAITVADLGADLNKPLLSARFAGTGGIEGGTEAAQRIKRRTWGRAFNIEGRVIDKANNIYEFGDPAYPWQEFTTVRDIGRDAAPALTVVAWAGSVAATLTALIASTPAQGSGAVAPSIACAKWWTQPAGPLTADVKGEIGSGYVETAASVAERILAAVAGPAITNVATANGWRPGIVGIHVEEGETIASVLDQLLMGVSLLWILNPAGTITLREPTFASPVEALTADTVERLRTFKPVKTRRLGYQRSYRVHSDGEIASSLLQIDPDAGSVLEIALVGVTTTTLLADHTGSILDGQLPRNDVYKLLRGATDLTASAAWAVTEISGDYTGTIGVATGILNTTGLAVDSVIRITASYLGKTWPLDVKVVKSSAAPPVGGGSGGGTGGTADSDTTINSINSASMAAVTKELEVTVGSAGQVSLNAPLDVGTTTTSPAGTFKVYGIWQWWDGAAWVDLGTETGSSPDCVVVNEAGSYVPQSGYLTVSATKTGLAAASIQKFRLRARNSSGTRTMYLSGTASAQG
jgi:hypothetical protein